MAAKGLGAAAVGDHSPNASSAAGLPLFQGWPASGDAAGEAKHKEDDDDIARQVECLTRTAHHS